MRSDRLGGPPLNYFFVTGNPKSGTTWMQLLIDAHPQAVCSGEGHFIELFVDPLLKMKEGYNHRLRLGVERVYQGKRYYDDLTTDNVIAIARQFIVEAISRRAGPETLAVGDKTPRHNLRLGDLNAIFPQARLINIVRHPYDVAVSRLHHARRAGMPEALEQGSRAHLDHVTNAAKAWMGGQASVARFQARQPGVLLEVRYEDMLDDPHAGAVAIFRHIGVSDAADAVAAAVAASDFEAQSGRKRGEAHDTSFFRKGIAGDWKGTLDPAAIGVLNELCGPAFTKLGYEPA
jgi:hypothetical protein